MLARHVAALCGFDITPLHRTAGIDQLDTVADAVQTGTNLTASRIFALTDIQELAGHTERVTGDIADRQIDLQGDSGLRRSPFAVT